MTRLNAIWSWSESVPTRLAKPFALPKIGRSTHVFMSTRHISSSWALLIWQCSQHKAHARTHTHISGVHIKVLLVCIIFAFNLAKNGQKWANWLKVISFLRLRNFVSWRFSHTFPYKYPESCMLLSANCDIFPYTEKYTCTVCKLQPSFNFNRHFSWYREILEVNSVGDVYRHIAHSRYPEPLLSRKGFLRI